MRAASPGSRLLAEPRGWPGSRWFTVHRSQAHRRAKWEVGSEQVGAATDGLPGVLGTSPRLRPPVDGVTQCVGLLSTSPRPGGWVPRGCQSDGMWPLTEHDRRHAPGSAQQVVGAGARPQVCSRGRTEGEGAPQGLHRGREAGPCPLVLWPGPPRALDTCSGYCPPEDHALGDRRPVAAMKLPPTG